MNNLDPYDEDDDPSEYDDYMNIDWAGLAAANRAKEDGNA